VFIKKEDRSDLQQLLEESKKQLTAVQSGQFNCQLGYVAKDQLLQQIIDNFNKVNTLREEFESRQKHIIDTMLRVNKIGFWELFLEDIEYDSPKNRVVISPELQALLGYTPGELKNDLMELSRISHPDYASTLDKMLRAHLHDFTGKTPFDMVHLMKFKDGSYRWVRTYGYAKRHDDGTPYYMIAVITDIHEEEMSRRELDAYITRYELIMNVLEEAPWDMEIKDGDPTNLDNPWWWSDQFRRTLGFTDERDFPNVMSSWSDRVHPDDVKRTFAALSAHLNDRTGNTPFNVEYRLKLKSGEYRWFLANGISARDKNGVPTRIAGTIRDITHLKLKQQNVEETTARMEKLAASIAEMVNGITEISAQAQQLAMAQEKTTTSANEARTLADETQEISNFIKGIAGQTNLLGLNAAIEAARAGEHGRGFGVVAEEVRKLADNSSKATGNIENILSKMKESIEAIIKQMELVNELAQTQAALSEEVNASIDEINKMSQDLVEFAKKS